MILCSIPFKGLFRTASQPTRKKIKWFSVAPDLDSENSFKSIKKLESLRICPELRVRYFSLKEKFKKKFSESKIDPYGVYANNELNLNEIDVYGFDYDYTLAVYKESLNYLIYDLGRDELVNKYKYPKGILSMKYVPDFAIRGLHYDIEHGLLTKIDSFHQIQFGSVYRGFTPLSNDEVKRIYGGSYISQSKIRSDKDHPKMKQLNDLFSVPEISLLVNVSEYFIQNNVSYCPEILFHDVQSAVKNIHPVMHKMLTIETIGNFVKKSHSLKEFLYRLYSAKKKLFLITNSPFHFVDTGMKYMMGDEWTKLFDLIVVHARKPKFFTDIHRPFRCYQKDHDTFLWEEVTKFEPGKIYMEGTVKRLLEITGWRGNNILYFGDQIYSDLADITLFYGWRTGAVISELEKEINTLNSDEFTEAISELEAIQELIDENQHRTCRVNFFSDRNNLLDFLFKDRETLRGKTKSLFNPQFGSIFRTHHNPTYFSRRLFRYSDIYMANITNLLKYSLNFIFCPRRGTLPHEKMITEQRNSCCLALQPP